MFKKLYPFFILIAFSLIFSITIDINKTVATNYPKDLTCFDNSNCNKGHYCAKLKGYCNSSGICTLKPDMCFLYFAPVCGCDGVTYSNECDAASNGVSVDYQGSCSTSCATFDFFSNTLQTPCFNLGNTSYWLDLALVEYEPVILELKKFGKNNKIGNVSECALFDSVTNTLHIPCFDFANIHYWLDLGLISCDPIKLQLQNYGEYIGVNPKVSGCGGFDNLLSENDYCNDERLIWQYDQGSQIVTFLNNNVWLNCCGVHSINISLNKETGTYIIDEVDRPESTGSRCICMCFFDFSIDLPNISSEKVNIELYRYITDGVIRSLIWKGELNLSEEQGNELIKESVGWCD